MLVQLQMLCDSVRRRRQERRRRVIVLVLLVSLLLVLSLTACAPICPQPVPSLPTIPAAPELTTPMPPEPYSTFWSRELSDLRERVRALRPLLTGTPATP